MLFDPFVMAERIPPNELSAAQVRALKKRLRSLRWKPEAVMREVVLIRRLREVVILSESAGTRLLVLTRERPR
jgi:hypothetical protein